MQEECDPECLNSDKGRAWSHYYTILL